MFSVSSNVSPDNQIRKKTVILFTIWRDFAVFIKIILTLFILFQLDIQMFM